MLRTLLPTLFALLALAATAAPAGAAPFQLKSDDITSSDDAVTLTVADTANISIQVTGTWTATLQFEGTVNGVTWVSVDATPIPSSTVVSSTAANGVWSVSSALRAVRVRASAYTSGTAAVTILATAAGGGGGGSSGGAVTQSGTWTVQPGNTANTTPWLVTPYQSSANLFSAPAALGDNVSTPTVGGIQAFLYCYDTSGGNWDRCLTGSATDTEDGSIAGGQSNVALVATFPYSFDGTNFTRAGTSICRTISAASDNEVSCKGSAGVLYGITATNVNAEERYLKLYNKASAPTCGTDTPVMTVLIPGATTGNGITAQIPVHGVAFTTGIAYCLTTGVGDSDNTNVAANEIVVHLLYK